MRRALIVGGANGIGLAIATLLAFMKKGNKVNLQTKILTMLG